MFILDDMPQAINQHNLKFQASADSHVNFPCLVRAPFTSNEYAVFQR